MMPSYPLDCEMKVYSDDGKWVEVNVEIKKSTKVTGKDFVSGGLHDFASSSRKGVVITVKAQNGSDQKKTAELIRSTITEELGSPPTVLPPAKVSGIIFMKWIGDTFKTEDELLNSIGVTIKQSKLKKHLF